MYRRASPSRQTLPRLRAMFVLCIAFASAAPPAATRGESTVADEGDTQRLASYRLIIPVVGTAKRNLIDTYNDRREGHSHQALDIAAPRGTQVVAAGDGRVVKLFDSAAGGLTVYQFDPSERYAYYYAHLDKYAQGLTEGMMLRRGDPIGAVGSTGNANRDAPHLHFAVFKLGPEKQWWKGSPINPFPLLN
jgi:murein DD-endopeptidase MepM/ murein hydrolase activator NlpD